jgi:hypothetical protein
MLDSTAQSVSSGSADVRIVGGGSVFLFILLTDDAREWVDAYVSDDRVMFGGGIAVEHRYAASLAAGMVDAGLVLEARS